VSYWLHPDAEAELGDAAVYYATHASLAIAEAFLAEYERVRDLLVENQRRGPHLDDGLRVCHFDRFPYSLIYATRRTRSAGHRSTR
jgi:plasmid stabilization system protein ParE